jgi:hypothetical protein
MRQPLNEQYARMQKLAGIKPINENYNTIEYTKKHDILVNFLIKEYLSNHKQTLLENQLTEGALKNFISAVKDNFSKSHLPKLNTFLKGLTFTKKPAEMLAVLSALNNAGVDLKDKKELNIAFNILKSQASKAQSVKEASDEEPNSKTPELTTVNGKEGYYIDQPLENGETKKVFVTKEDWDLVGDKIKTSGVKITGPLGKFLKNTLVGKLLTGALSLGAMYVGLADEIGETAQALDIDLDGADAASQETIRSLYKAGYSTEDIKAFLDNKFSADAGGQSGAALNSLEQSFGINDGGDGEDDAGESTDNLGNLETDDLDVTDAKDQGLDIDSSDNQTLNFIKFKNGSSQLDQDDLNKISQENADIIKFLKNGQNYSETILGIASHSANNSNVDAQGGDLNVNRANNTAEAAIDDLESQLKEEGIKYTRSGNTIELEDGGTYELKIGGGNDTDKLTQIDKTDDTATQSAIRVGEVGEKDAPVTPPDPTTLLGYDPLFDTYGNKKEKPTGQEEPARQEEPTGDEIDTTNIPNEEPAVIQPAQIKQDVNSIAKLNRNGQIAFILARISPKMNLFKYLKKDAITSLSDNDLDKIKKGKTPQMAKVLAQLIPNLRKSPDQFLKRISALTGVELEPRAKAVSTSPNSQAQTNQVNENQYSLKVLLQEAAIDDLFTKLGITPETVKQNRIEIAALAASMYASAANTSVSILNTDKLTPEEQKELAGLGFGSQQGKDYVFLQPGQTAKQAQGSNDKKAGKSKTQSDVDRVNKSMGNKTSLKTDLLRINTKKELTDLVLGILNLIDTNLTKDKGQMRNLMFGLRNRIQEADETEKDTSTVIKRILQTPELKSLFGRINTAEEGIQLILRDIIPMLNKDFLAKKNEIRGAIISAANTYTNASTPTTKKPDNAK